MLAQLLRLLEAQESAMSLAEVSRSLNAQPSAVLEMIEMLVRKGKLVEIGPDGQCCGNCGEQADCSLLVSLGKRYAAASRLAVIQPNE